MNRQIATCAAVSAALFVAGFAMLALAARNFIEWLATK